MTRPAARCSTPCHKDAEEGGTRPGCPTRHLLAHARALRADWTKRSKRNVGRRASRPWRPAVRRGSPTAPWFRCNVRVRDRAGTCADGATSFILVTRLWGVCAGGWRRKFGCRKPPAPFTRRWRRAWSRDQFSSVWLETASDPTRGASAARLVVGLSRSRSV